MNALPAPLLCLVTDRRQLLSGPRTTSEELSALNVWLDEAITADLDLIVIRERDLDARDQIAIVRRLMALRGPNAPRVVINDRADVALAARADGVHLRSDSAPIGAVRQLGGATWLIGRSVHTAAEIVEQQGADYLLVGTAFRSRSKPADTEVTGLDVLRQAASSTRTPLVAVGGITPENAPVVMACGASGVAAIGAFLPPGRAPGALGPVRAAVAFRHALLR